MERLGALLQAIWPDAENVEKPLIFFCFWTLGRSWRPLGDFLERLVGVLERLGSILERLGAVLERLRGDFERIGVIFAASWSLLSPLRGLF